MNFKEIAADIYPIVSKYAPSIASAIGSPISGMATAFGLNVLANAFGINPSDIKNLPAIINNNDSTVSEKLCELEQTFSEWFKMATVHNFRLPQNLEITIKASWVS